MRKKVLFSLLFLVSLTSSCIETGYQPHYIISESCDQEEDTMEYQN